jgi:hypothetical protein
MQVLHAVIALFGFSIQGLSASRLSKNLAARSIAAAGRPDPKCHSGVVSLPFTGTKDPQVCCAGYCGECTDYPTCGSVKGQDSANACCASKVLAASCDKGAPANTCLKKCSESVPPCIMDSREYEEPDPDARNAMTDCNKAVPDWMVEAKNAVSEVEGIGEGDAKGPSGKDQWKLMSERNFEKSSVMRAKMEKLVGHLPANFDFGTLDSDKSKGLSYDEMQKYFGSAMPGGYDSTVAKSVYDHCDSDKDGEVSKIEMSACMAGMGGPKPAAAFIQAMICLLHH